MRDSVNQILQAAAKLSKTDSAEALAMLLTDDGHQLREIFVDDYDKNKAWYIIGDVFFKKQNYIMAKRCFEECIRYDPDDKDAALALGNTLMELGALQNARSVLQQFHVAFPDDERILYNLANYEFDMGDFENALEKYKRVCVDKELVRLAKRNAKLCDKRLRQKQKK